MIEANKSLTPLLVKAVLVRTAQQLGGFGSKFQSLLTQGAGEVNAVGAVEMARAMVPNADHLQAGDKLFRPNMALNSLASVSIGGENVPLSNRVLYSDGVLFAHDPVLTNGAILGEGII